MASFVIHTIAAKRFLSVLKEKGFNIPESVQNEFLLSNLIADSSKLKFTLREGENEKEAKSRYRAEIQQEKIATHFRSEDDLELCIQSPKLELFTTKYQDLLESGNIHALAYLFHLYTDKVFFENLFPEAFETLDSEYTVTDIARKTKYIHVKKNGRVYTATDFWDKSNDESIYHDYTVMNRILLESYNVTFDKESLSESAKTYKNPGIAEVAFENIGSIINKTSTFIAESYASEDNGLNVFNETQIISFIETLANEFINKYGHYFNIRDTYQKKLT